MVNDFEVSCFILKFLGGKRLIIFCFIDYEYYVRFCYVVYFLISVVKFLGIVGVYEEFVGVD